MRTKTISVHRLRTVARRKERRIQEALDRMARQGIGVEGRGRTFVLSEYGAPQDRLPLWTRGVRVEKAGRFQWTVVATEYRGH